MSRLIARWTALDNRRRIAAVLSALAVVAVFVAVLRIGTEPSRALLFSGLDSAAAGDVLAALDARGVNYDVRGNAIYVPATERDSLRLSLASDGLPSVGAVGFELLDTLSGFSTTSEMFNVAHRRALEGEIARTLVSTKHFRQARVHIALGDRGPFSKNVRLTASATVLPTSGTLSPAQADAVRHLIASAVTGMEIGDVAVIDAQSGRIVGNAGQPSDSRGSMSDEETRLKQRVEDLLAARVGQGNAIAAVSIVPFRDREQLVERTIDPDSRVAISMEKEERRAKSTDATAGQVTVASNLPEGDANASDRSSSSDDNESRELVNYEISEVRREIERDAGGIARLSVAVLVNSLQLPSGEYEPRPEGELEDLRELVESAVGFSGERGDTITIRSMEFLTTDPAGTEIAQSLLSGLAVDADALLRLTVLSILALGLGLFVLRPIMTAPALPKIADQSSNSSLQVLERKDEQRTSESALPAPPDAEPAVEIVDLDIDAMTSIGPSHSPAGGALQDLRSMITNREDEAVAVLKDWIDDEKAPI